MKPAQGKHHELDTKMSQIFSLPVEILSFLNTPRADRLTEYVMARICDKQCCDIKKAAFFVNNPDFNCCQGIVGYEADDLSGVAVRDESFDRIIRAFDASSFNKSVKTFASNALKGTAQNHIGLMAQAIGLKNPTIYEFDLKHGNKGIFLYEKEQSDEQPAHASLLITIASLLGFCPLFF